MARWRTPATLLLVLALLLPAFTLPAPASAAGLIVNSLLDTTGNHAFCTLRDAITAANSNTAVGGCGAGSNSGTDAITFQAGLFGTGQLGGDLPAITTSIAITGLGVDNLTIDRHDRNGDVFTVGTGGHLDLADLNVLGADRAIYLSGDAASVTVRDTRLLGNTTGFYFADGGTATLTDTFLSGNTTGFRFEGGGAATLTNDALLNNNTGLRFEGGGETTLTNVTLSNGFSLHFVQGGTATLTNSTLVGSGYGLYFDGQGGTATLTNSLLAFAPAGGKSCFGGMATDSGHNLADEASCFAGGGANGSRVVAAGGANGSRVVAAGTLGLSELRLNNGGPTETFALLPGSPAIDSADLAFCPQTDQRGVTRPQGAGCDIGAVELFTSPTPTLTAIQPTSVPQTTAPTPSGATITVTVTGTGFIPNAANGGSYATFNGGKVFTTYISPTQLSFTLFAVWLTNAGSFPMRIINPSPGGGTSVDQTFTVVAPSPSPSSSPLPSPSASPSTGPAPSFADVPGGYWAHDQIGIFAQRKITTGCGDNDQGQRLYCPERGVTRAEMATFLTRALGQDKQAPPATPTFADVPADYWAYEAIEAFVKLGITTGCGEDDQGRAVFCPGRGVTRAEMAAFLVRAQGQTQLAAPAPTFADVPSNYWAYGWVERLYALELTTGCGDDDQGRVVYCPGRGVTRAEMAVFILRAYP